VASEFEPLEELAEAVLLGQNIDWASAESSAGEPQREAVRQLKVLARIAELHRNLAYDIPDEAPPKLERWGRLELLECIGRGSFGEVYRAWDSKLDREVAVKLLHADGAQAEGATVLREARLLARVRHPNVVTVYDADEIEGRVGLWMEFIHGRNLDQVLAERKKLDDREVTRIGIEVCRALSAVHDAGLLHRDIKAQNLMQTGDGRLVLMDFGTGRELEATPSSDVDAAGTPLYLAPELFDGGAATVRSDVYSTGVLLFHLLTGAYPVRGATVQEVRDAHARGERIDLVAKAPGVNKTLAAAISRAIDPDPSKRFATSREMLVALDNVQRKAEARRRERSWLALAAVAVVTVAIAAVPALRRQNPDRSQPGRAAYFGVTPEKREVNTPRVMFPGIPSPDGRFFPYSGPDGNVAIYEFATGTSRTLTTGGDAGDTNFASYPVLVSPDSSHLAYPWEDGSCKCTQIRVIDADGTNMRALYEGKGPTEMFPIEWTSAGGHIFGTRGDEILLLSAQDGSIRTLRTLPGAGRVRLSPDGRYLAYDRGEDPDDTDRGIYITATDEGPEIPLTTGRAYDSHPMWTPNGSGIVFASNRTGGPDLWLQPIQDGRPDGRPQLLDKDMGPFAPITLTRRGSLFYDHRTGLMDVYTVPIDPVTGDVRGAPTNAANRFLGSNISPDWSPDGNTLVFASWRSLFGPGQNILVFHSMDTGLERELEVDLARVNAPRWSSDGRFVFVSGPDQMSVGGLRLVDVESGKIVDTYFAKPGDLPPVSSLAWGPDGRHAYMRRDMRRISSIDLKTGEEETLYRSSPEDVLGGLAVSPDGQWLAFNIYIRAEKLFHLFVMPTAGGRPRSLLETSEPKGGSPAGWTRDGKQVLFVRTTAVDGKHKGEFWAVPFDGGSARSLGLTMDALRDVRVSPNGDRIAFTSGYPDKGLWVFENFLPQAPAR
jgi:Tol biopolymer transport system component/predicted Ser/Thr protein kinase